MSIHAIGLIGLVLIFVIGTLRPINLGALGLVMTFLVGTFFAGENVGTIVSGFPVDLFILLSGVTYLFAVAVNNGTVERIVEGAAHLFRDRRAMIPVVVFVVASLPAMAGALGSAGVAILAPIALRLAQRYRIDRRMIGLLVVHGAAAGNFSPLNPLGVLVYGAVRRNGLDMSLPTLFLGNLVYNVVLGVVIYVSFGGLRLFEAQGAAGVDLGEARAGADDRDGTAEDPSTPHLAPGLRIEQLCTLAALVGAAVGALGFGLNIGFLGFGAAVLLQLVFPGSSGQAERKVAWGVVLLVCGIVTYVAALQRFGTVQAVGDAIATLNMPMVSALLICGVGAVTSAFASSAGILGAMIPLAAPFMASGDIGTTGLVVALAVSATVVDATPFSTVGALVVANSDESERPQVFWGLLKWGGVMILTAPLLTWLLFVLPNS